MVFIIVTLKSIFFLSRFLVVLTQQSLLFIKIINFNRNNQIYQNVDVATKLWYIIFVATSTKRGPYGMNQAIQILDLLIKIQESSDIFPHEWEETFDGINLLEIHCIDRIGKIQYANVTKIANEMEMTRGSISKICKRIINKGLVESYQRSDNHKEIYYRLTESGQRIYNGHEKCHHQARQEELSLMNTFSEYEQSIIFRFLNGINYLHNRQMVEEKNDQG